VAHAEEALMLGDSKRAEAHFQHFLKIAKTLLGATLFVVFGCGSGCGKATVIVSNSENAPVTVFVAFGSDSVVLPPSFSFCTASGALACSFPLAANGSQRLPLSGQYLNATLSVGGPVACGMTKIELNLNNPAWYDIVDVSLVDGFSTSVEVQAKDSSGTHELKVDSAAGNEKAFGVYPYGCDLCVERSLPPCGIPKGREGCKKGPDQYHPDVPCQYQGTKKGGGSSVAITFD